MVKGFFTETRFLIKLKCSLLLCMHLAPRIAQAQNSTKPNVLFVAFDDLNDWEGILSGHPQTYTPNIDKLAKRGTLFANAHAAGLMCCPSRASVITGLRPTSTGIYTNSDQPFHVYQNRQTLNKHFKENGYYVAGAGKILHQFHFEQGQWDDFLSREELGENIIKYNKNPEKNDIRRLENSSISWGGIDAPDSLTFDAQSVKWAAKKLQEEHKKPFFIACGIYRPHIPWFNPKRYFDQHPLEAIQLPETVENDLDDIPLRGKNVAFSTSNFTKSNDRENDENNAEHENFLQNGQWPEAVQAYLASISYADAQFGKLLEALDNSRYAENTIIVLWSDHGWHLGQKEHWRKATLWEEVTHVPLLISGPGIPHGQICKEAVSLIDIFPTLIDLCQLPAINDLEGQSLTPQLENPRKKRKEPAISSLTPEFHAIRNERYRYISYGQGQEELYDHSSDPKEWVNIVHKRTNRKTIRRLKRHIPKNAKPPCSQRTEAVQLKQNEDMNLSTLEHD
ncbi:sulfatase [Marinilongibacter aquaticus]|uniref:sulfatase n=1 Tax=Marinilongibacter aquaticus TaxID=2975157 RepID=UPI0021BD44DB|nr:sulfatase [Marinilongibacter aquaticus]UBM58702.1 sulfatase [Marinilongibacter aquaticus]